MMLNFLQFISIFTHTIKVYYESVKLKSKVVPKFVIKSLFCAFNIIHIRSRTLWNNEFEGAIELAVNNSFVRAVYTKFIINNNILGFRKLFSAFLTETLAVPINLTREFRQKFDVFIVSIKFKFDQLEKFKLTFQFFFISPKIILF